MVGLLVVTHGGLARELAQAVQTIVGEVDGLEGLAIGWDDGVEHASRLIEEARERVDRGRGVLILTDMFGGTPTNLALSLHEPGSVEIVTGVNLPMLVKFTDLRETTDLPEMAARIAEQGREAIHVATEVLGTPDASPGEERS
ncbi:MAG: hypothetical protein GY716_11700 [bacterium]|nr:hypothetical protein [bacterium]